MTVITAVCKICKKSVSVDQFKLSYIYKMMVCPNCFAGKTKLAQENAQKAESAPKPRGWDAEDEYLEKMSKMKQKETNVQFEKISGTSQVKCTCPHCEFQFKYDPFRKLPRTCPYCDNEIPKLKLFNLL